MFNIVTFVFNVKVKSNKTASYIIKDYRLLQSLCADQRVTFVYNIPMFLLSAGATIGRYYTIEGAIFTWKTANLMSNGFRCYNS